MCFTDFKKFWRDAKHVTYAVLLLLIFIDIIVYTIIKESSSGHIVRWSRPLRPFLIVNIPEARQIRMAFRNVRKTLPDIFSVIILVLSSVALFSLMAVKLFGTKGLVQIDGRGYFDDFFDSYWDLYVLITTANSPDVAMPAYDHNRLYVIFFIVFLIVNLYMFMSVFLAVVYNSYKDNLKTEVKESVEHKRSLLEKVHENIKEPSDGQVTKETFMSLMKLTMPKKGQDYFQALWLILDKDDQGFIQRSDLAHIVELVRLKTTNLSDGSTLAEKWMPNVYNSAPSKFVISCVKHVFFRYLFDFIILVNAVCIAFDVDAHWLNIFLVLFSIEIVLKLYSFGTRAFFQKLWNIFDVVVVGSALAVSLYQLIRPDQLDPDSLDLLLVMRVIRIFKIFHSIPRFRIVIDTILHILPSMGIYGAILLLFYYSFAIVGMEIFGGRFK